MLNRRDGEVQFQILIFDTRRILRRQDGHRVNLEVSEVAETGKNRKAGDQLCGLPEVFSDEREEDKNGFGL